MPAVGPAASPCSFNAEFFHVLLRLRFELFYFVHARGAGTFMQFGAKRKQFFAGALRKDFHRAVGPVTHPPGDAKGGGFFLDKPTKADTLHASAYAVGFGFEFRFVKGHKRIASSS